LNIYGDWDLLGSVQLTSGQISFVGSDEQYLDAGGSTIEFNDLVINNSSGGNVTFFESVYIINGTLFPNQGTLLMSPSLGNELIINSTSGTGGGRIAAFNGSSSIVGPVTVRRFIEPGSADWRNLSSPVSNATFVQWDDDLFISGTGFPDGCAI